jgi:predicted nucleic acid-binding protein
MELPRVETAIEKICLTNALAAISEKTVRKALFIHGKYGYSYYDSLMVASALENGCEYLLSEDMADGQVIEGTLTVRNIFSE